MTSKHNPSEQLHVALVTPGFPPRIGGVEVHVEELAKGLAAQGHTVTVLAQTNHGVSADAEPWEWPGVSVRRFKDVTRTNRFPIAPTMRAYLKQHAAEFDVIHAHSFHAWPALMAARIAPKTFVFTPHYHGVGHTLAARALHLAYDPIASTIFARANAVICVSRIEAEKLTTDYPHARDNLLVIPNGIEMESIHGAVPFHVGCPVVLVAGRIEGYKQVGLVIDAMEHLAHDVELVVVGDGPERSNLERKVSASVSRHPIRFTGRIGQEDLRRWQATAAVTVCMSKEEAFGLVAAEAAASGSFVLASDIPAHREMSQLVGDGMALVPVDSSPISIAAKLERVLTHPWERSTAPPFLDWSEVTRRTIDAYVGAPRSGSGR